MTAPMCARFSTWLEETLLNYGLAPRDAHAVTQAAEKQLATIVPMTVEEENAAAILQCRNFVNAVREFESGKKQPRAEVSL